MPFYKLRVTTKLEYCEETLNLTFCNILKRNSNKENLGGTVGWGGGWKMDKMTDVFYLINSISAENKGKKRIQFFFQIKNLPQFLTNLLTNLIIPPLAIEKKLYKIYLGL